MRNLQALNTSGETTSGQAIYFQIHTIISPYSVNKSDTNRRTAPFPWIFTGHVTHLLRTLLSVHGVRTPHGNDTGCLVRTTKRPGAAAAPGASIHQVRHPPHREPRQHRRIHESTGSEGGGRSAGWVPAGRMRRPAASAGAGVPGASGCGRSARAGAAGGARERSHPPRRNPDAPRGAWTCCTSPPTAPGARRRLPCAFPCTRPTMEGTSVDRPDQHPSGRAFTLSQTYPGNPATRAPPPFRTMPVYPVPVRK